MALRVCLNRLLIPDNRLVTITAHGEKTFRLKLNAMVEDSSKSASIGDILSGVSS